MISQKKGYGNRVWEVDLLRGILILFVVFDHVMFDIGAMFADSFSTPLGIRISDWAAGYVFESSAFGRWRSVTHDFFIGSFVILSGVSVSFSKNNALRGLKMSVWAVGLSVAMLFYGEITQDNSVWMNFNVLHVLACFLAGQQQPRIQAVSRRLSALSALFRLVSGGRSRGTRDIQVSAQYYGL